MESILYIALTLFLVANPIGNLPVMVLLVKDFPVQRQRKILIREAFFSFLIAVFFLFIGDNFLQLIQIKPYAVSIAGGTLLFLVALDMIFPASNGSAKEALVQEPFIVPIATPLISGGGVLSTIMIYAAREQNDLKIFTSCVLAWIGVLAVVACAGFLQKIFGRRGLLALEQLMGMILTMISMEIVVKGIQLFMKEFH